MKKGPERKGGEWHHKPGNTATEKVTKKRAVAEGRFDQRGKMKTGAVRKKGGQGGRGPKNNGQRQRGGNSEEQTEGSDDLLFQPALLFKVYKKKKKSKKTTSPPKQGRNNTGKNMVGGTERMKKLCAPRTKTHWKKTKKKVEDKRQVEKKKTATAGTCHWGHSLTSAGIKSCARRTGGERRKKKATAGRRSKTSKRIRIDQRSTQKKKTGDKQSPKGEKKNGAEGAQISGAQKTGGIKLTVIRPRPSSTQRPKNGSKH